MIQPMHRVWVALVLLVFVTGCHTAPRIVPPTNLAEPIRVAVADYGDHSSLIVPELGGAVTEYVYGDWNWYAAGHMECPDGLRALFYSGGAALGQRSLALDIDDPSLRRELGAERLLRFDVERERVDVLAQRLNDRFAEPGDRTLYNAERGLLFVHDDARYVWHHNCNHMTAKWLEELGCRVEGWVLYSDFRVVPVGP
jgi:hypothetical protein